MKKYLFTALYLVMALFVSGQTADTIFVQVDGLKLFSVLSKPKNLEKCPIAVIIAGSGPTDHNGNQPNLINNSLKYLSDALVENGIATFRFDKRGIGKSSYSGLNEANLTIDQFAKDVESIIKFCKANGYPDIYVIGHSEGSLLGLMALQTISVKGFISIAGAGSAADEILKKQLKPKLPQPMYSQVELIIDSLKNNHLVKNVPPQLISLFRPSVQPYLISWFQNNPAELIGKLTCPCLIAQGNKDIQVDMDEAKKLIESSKNGKLLVVTNMNHVLKIIQGIDIQENYASYTNPALPVHHDLITGVVDFINQQPMIK